MDTPPATALAPLDPGLQQLERNPRFAKLLRVDGDLTELAAVLEDIQTLVDRCGYHHKRAILLRQTRNTRRAPRDTSQRGRRLGRPRGAVNFAARQFGLGLALIWWECTGRRPSRHEPERLRERGSYTEFVHLIVQALPPSSRRMPDGTSPEIEYLVRISSKDFRAAVQSPEEYRRRGLFDERDWLRGEDATP